MSLPQTLSSFAALGHLLSLGRPYLSLARLNRPHGIWLLLFPSWWGLSLDRSPPPSLLLLFALGALLMRSAGCVYNDIIDKEFDKHVTRTALRPLATQEITLGKAGGFFLFLLSAAFFVLIQLPLPAIGMGGIALFLVLLYPWMKRLTYWPQAFLGITYNIGILMGTLSLPAPLSWPPFLFYGGSILWTLGFDTIYGLQDREDDMLIGIKSSALIVFPYVKLFLSLTYGGALLFWAVSVWLLNMAPIFWIFWSFSALILIWQISTLKKNNPLNCLIRFKSNSWVGLLLFLGLVFSHMIL